jgi:ABC-2 type transport system permease protein
MTRFSIPQINPILIKELRSRMRGARAFVILTGMLLLLGLVSYLVYVIAIAAGTYSYTPLSPQIGQSMFSVVMLIELTMICFLTPAVTAGAISGEMEKQTFEMLQATPLKALQILSGKLISALSYIFLLIFAAVPLASLVFTFGGVALRDMLKALIVLATTAVLLGCVSLFASVWLKRTMRATVVSYLFVITIVIAPLVLYILSGVLQNDIPARELLIANPVSALFSALSPSLSSSGSMTAFGQLGMAITGDLSFFDGSFIGYPRPLYHYTLPLYALLSLGLFTLSARKIRPTIRRRSWREERSLLLLLATIMLVTALFFALTTNRYELRARDDFFLTNPQPRVPVKQAIEPTVPEVIELTVEDEPPLFSDDESSGN